MPDANLKGKFCGGNSVGESLTDAVLNVFRISGVAWALTVHKAAQAYHQGSTAERPDVPSPGAAPSFPALEAGMMETAEAELLRAGIVDGHGALSQQWLLAAWISAFAPLKAVCVVQSDEESVHTEIALAGGRGVGVTYSRRVRHRRGVEVAEVRNAVEICFFAEENAWAALKRHLPDTGRVPEVPEPGTSRSAGYSDAATDARYTVHVEVAAHPAASRPVALADGPAAGRVSKDVWVLAEELYSVSIAASGEDSELTLVSPGDIGQTFAWRLLGAREYLASAAEQAA